ncbi:MAG: NUDIX hydrolase [Candidatus Blackburnbacteria bacterium]|nr:NUDIX hydrolase [Candidatus Blackburnbacteria bacterium]
MSAELTVERGLRTPEILEKGAGVCLLVVTPDGLFCAIQEKSSKRITQKLKGMFSAPFETVEAGESHQQALVRITQEEVRMETERLIMGPELCRIQLDPGVWLHTYVAIAEEKINLQDGIFEDEVSGACWIPLEEVENPTNKRFRPGMREIVESYRAFLAEGEAFRTCIYFTYRDRISEEEFAAAGV